MMHLCRRGLCGLLLVTALLALVPRTAWAADPKVDAKKGAAKQHYDRGTALFALDRYDEAIKEFEEGFLEVQQPAFLFNIGQAHKRAGRPAKARSYFERYVEMAPDASDRPQVEKLIAEIDAEARAARLPATAEGKPAAATPDKPELKVDPRAVTGSAPANTAATAAPTAESAAPPAAPASPAPATSKPKWLWGVIAGAGALVVAGVVVGVVLGTRSSAPTTDFGVVEPFK